jgi:hypothetical protein
MTKRTSKITVTLSTNPSVDGRYFVDVRDTTKGHNRQLTTRTNDADYVRDFVRDVKMAARIKGIDLTIEDTTSELGF